VGMDTSGYLLECEEGRLVIFWFFGVPWSPAIKMEVLDGIITE
jgi:hypothetical protein